MVGVKSYPLKSEISPAKLYCPKLYCPPIEDFTLSYHFAVTLDRKSLDTKISAIQVMWQSDLC